MGLLDGVDRLHAGLDYHLARHNLLTANLTHVDTPNYKPVDLDRGAVQAAGAPGDFSAALKVEMQAASTGQSIGASANDSAVSRSENFKVFADPASAASNDGNGVSIDREGAKIAANHVRYEALAQLVSGELSGLSWAVNDGKGG